MDGIDEFIHVSQTVLSINCESGLLTDKAVLSYAKNCFFSLFPMIGDGVSTAYTKARPIYHVK